MTSKTISPIDARLLRVLETSATAVGGCALALMLALTLLEVVRRNLFNAPIVGLVDIVEWLLPFAALGGIASAQRLGDHFRMEIFVNMTRGRVRWLIEAAGSAAALFFAGVVAVYTSRATFKAWSIADISADIEWPLWPPKLAITTFFWLLFFRLLLQTVSLLRVAFNPLSNGDGVPDSLKNTLTNQNHAS